MSDDFLKKTRNQIRNAHGVETKPEYLADVFAAYNKDERARLLNDWDNARGGEGFDGETQRATADNLALRIRMEAMHQALMKANR